MITITADTYHLVLGAGLAVGVLSAVGVLAICSYISRDCARRQEKRWQAQLRRKYEQRQNDIVRILKNQAKRE